MDLQKQLEQHLEEKRKFEEKWLAKLAELQNAGLDARTEPSDPQKEPQQPGG